MANQKPAARHRDLCTGHLCFPPRPNATASPNVRINGRGAVRKGDGWLPHKCCEDCGSHSGDLSKGSNTVKINGREAGRVGDKISCRSRVMTGSGNVRIGDDPDALSGGGTSGGTSSSASSGGVSTPGVSITDEEVETADETLES